jgi:cobalamin biosynthesis protein CobC
MTMTALNDRPMAQPKPRAPRHGGRLEEARRLFPDAPEPFIDLSTGINPLPYPVPELGAAAWARLPEPDDIAALEQAARKAYALGDAAAAVAVPGTQLMISLLPRLFPATSVAILSPTYGEYARAFAEAGSAVVEARSLADLGGAEAAVICNPNNPDGRRFDATALIEALGERPRGLVLVDESFADLEDGALSLAPHLPLRGVVVLRSLSKSYGLGGLRLGFVLGVPETVAAIRAALGPWPISGPAIAIGAAALADETWRDQAKARLGAATARLDGLLRHAGLKVIGGTRLFRLAETARAAELFGRLGCAGILVRQFDYAPTWLRLGIPGGDDEWRRLAGVLG